MTFVNAFPGAWFWGVSDVPQSDPVTASWRCVWRGLETMFRQKTLADFRPKFWSDFGQNFGQISAKTLADFRHKKINFWIFALAFSENSSGRFPISVWPFSDFGFQFLRISARVWGPKSWPKSDQKIWSKTGHRSTECERACILGPSASHLLWPLFGTKSWSVLVSDFRFRKKTGRLRLQIWDGFP